jgi:hypothetical protein
MGKKRLVIVDADTLAGWRRSAPSLNQMWDAVDDLREQQPGVAMAVLADASLKWALSGSEKAEMEDQIARGEIVCPPAGTEGGLGAFLSQVVIKAKARGFEPVVVTDQLLRDVPLATIKRDGPRWVFDLKGAKAAVVAPNPQAGRRRQRGRSSAA